MQFFTSALILASAAATVSAGPIWCNVVMNGSPITANVPGLVASQLAMDAGVAVLTENGFHTHINTKDGGIGFFQACHYQWMNIQTSSKSYKPITFTLDEQTTHNWAIEADRTLKATATSEYKDTDTFLACTENDQTVLYLQTGKDVPSGNCTATKLTVPTN